MPSAQKIGIEHLASGGSNLTSHRRSPQYNFVSLHQAMMPKPKGRVIGIGVREGEMLSPDLEPREAKAAGE